MAARILRVHADERLSGPVAASAGVVEAGRSWHRPLRRRGRPSRRRTLRRWPYPRSQRWRWRWRCGHRRRRPLCSRQLRPSRGEGAPQLGSQPPRRRAALRARAARPLRIAPFPGLRAMRAHVGPARAPAHVRACGHAGAADRAPPLARASCVRRGAGEIAPSAWRAVAPRAGLRRHGGRGRRSQRTSMREHVHEQSAAGAKDESDHEPDRQLLRAARISMRQPHDCCVGWMACLTTA